MSVVVFYRRKGGGGPSKFRSSISDRDVKGGWARVEWLLPLLALSGPYNLNVFKDFKSISNRLNPPSRASPVAFPALQALHAGTSQPTCRPESLGLARRTAAAARNSGGILPQAHCQVR
eukprot:491140-Hanusia_phi.AAC.1